MSNNAHHSGQFICYNLRVVKERCFSYPLPEGVKEMKNRLQELRWKKGWSQQKLADRSNVSKSTIGGIENGKIKNPTIETAYRLSKALKVDILDIFYEEG